jgi:putative transposase
MGSIGDCYDNSVAESFFGTLGLELLDEHRWETRDQLANAIFDWIEAWYNPRRRHHHSYCGQLSPIDFETTTAAVSPHPTRLLDRSSVGLAPGIATP